MQGNNGKRKRPSRSYRAALAMLALITGLTAGAGPVCGAQEAGADQPAASAGLTENENEETSDNSVSETSAASENDAEDADSDENSSEDSERDEADPDSDDADGTVSEETEADDPEEDLDYILGRPMTEEEIEEQRDLEPSMLAVMPTVSGLASDDVNLDNVILEGSAADADTLPTSYDARTKGLVTSVKNQNTRTTNTCWAFSAASCAETSMIRQGLTIGGSQASRSTADLSELQLAYFFYHPTADALGNIASDKTSNISGSSDLMTGNHGIFTTLCLANWTGVAQESTAPYENASSSLSLDPDLCYGADVAHLQNAYWVDMSNTEAAKILIRKYGSLCASFYWESDSYNPETAAYFYQSSSSSKVSSNHMITIVGWDDEYKKENFENEPESDGAWLVKNSWGSDWGEAGYFWMSYEDSGLLNAAMPLGYVYDFDSADNYDHIYEYDGTCGFDTTLIRKNKISSGSSVANVFKVSGSDSGAECLKAVSLGIFSTDVEYSLQVYKNPEDGKPASGKAMLSEPQTGTFSYMGYMTVPLDETVVFKEGDTFSVVFTLTSGDGSSVCVMYDHTYQNGTWVSFTNMTEPGQSYTSSGTSWTDLGLNSDGSAAGTSGASVRLKAFTDSVDPITSVTLSESNVILALGKTKTLTAALSPADTKDDTTVVWTSSDTSVASVKDGMITAVGPGTAVIRAEAGCNQVSAECKVTVLATPAITSWKALSATKIQVTWNKVQGADGYRVYRRKAGGSWKRIAEIKSGDTVTCTDSAVPDYTNYYYYTVRAYVNTSADVILSGYDATGAKTKAIPVKPTLSAAVNSSSAVTVKWSKVLCDGYKLYRKVSGGSWKLVKILTGSSSVSYKDTSVVKGKTYYYTVRAYFRKGSVYVRSNYDATGVSGRAIPATPALSKVTSSSGGLTVKWGKVSGCHGYRVYRKTAGGKWKMVKQLSGCSYVSWKDTSAAKGTTYYYTVRAFYKSGTSYSLSGYNTNGITGRR